MGFEIKSDIRLNHPGFEIVSILYKSEKNPISLHLFSRIVGVRTLTIFAALRVSYTLKMGTRVMKNIDGYEITFAKNEGWGGSGPVLEDLNTVSLGLDRSTASENVCHQCYKSFTLKCNLSRHLKIHNENKTQVCSACKKLFMRKSDLMRHMKTHEKPCKLYTCALCGKQFARAFELDQHRKSHVQVKHYICSICETSFPRKKDLTAHMRIHRCSQILKYSCSTCNISFSRKRKLEAHMRIHKPLQTFSCTYCKSIFNSSEDLFTHIISHFRCEICSKTFATKQSFELHQRVSHRHAVLIPIALKRSTSREATLNMQLLSTKKALGVFSEFTLVPRKECSKDLLICFKDLRSDVVKLLEDEIDVKKAVKWYLVVTTRMSRVIEGVEETITPHFCSNAVIEMRSGVNSIHVEEAINKISTSFDEFVERGSNWVLENIENVVLKSAKYKPL